MEREMRGMNKIVIVSQKTRLQELIERFNTKEQAQFYIEHMGDSFDDYLDEDRCYAESLTYVRKKAEQYARVSVIDKSFLCNYIFGRDDLVVCVGRDGLVCNTMKYLEESNHAALRMRIQQFCDFDDGGTGKSCCTEKFKAYGTAAGRHFVQNPGG